MCRFIFSFIADFKFINETMSHKNSENGATGNRLSKRLCYILRYGAVKQGLTVHEGGNKMKQLIIVMFNTWHPVLKLLGVFEVK